MASTVIINRWTGASPGSQTDVTSTPFAISLSDVAQPGTAHPIIQQIGATVYSFWASIRLAVTVTPNGTIDNLTFYTDGTNSFGTGITMTAAKASTGTDNGYRQATGTVDVNGDILNQTNHTGLDAAPVDIFSYTPSAPLALNGSIANPNTGHLGDFVVFQMAVADTAAAGTTTYETLIFGYDET